MKRCIYPLTVVLAGMSSFAIADAYTIDPTHTYPSFEINHLGFSTMRGRFNETKGKFDLDLKKKTGSVSVVISAGSIDTGFKKRDDHLRSPDFLNVAEFPQIKFDSTKVVFTGDKTATVEGNLTIMATTKPLTLNVTAMNCGVNPLNKKETCGFDANATFKRSDFGVNYGLPAVGDEMKLLLEVEGIKD